MIVTETDNPLSPSAAHLERIRTRAYHLWEADGRPHGHAEEYWERARELEAMQSYEAGMLPNPQTAHPGRDPGTPIVEEAFLEDNLGEFPGRFTDQGETMTTPRGRRRSDQAPTSAPAAGADKARKPRPAKK